MKPAFVSAEILLPKNQDMNKWSVVACDQYTGNPSYWKQVEHIVGDAPSTLHLILPEIYLEQKDTHQRIQNIHNSMNEYLEKDVFNTMRGMIYIERTLSDGLVRQGLIGALDLEHYDFSPDSASLCRATEQTVPSRIPPRQKVREAAPLELPHVLVLIDDKHKTVIEPLQNDLSQTTPLYDFDLQQNGGHIRGFLLADEQMQKVDAALERLLVSSQEKFGQKLQFLVGDGNHSLATAKACYKKLKATLGEKAKEHPARYALVELNNLHSQDIVFEPIHRVLYNVDYEDIFAAFNNRFPQNTDGDQRITFYHNETEQTFTLTNPSAKLTLGTLQPFLDDYISNHPNVSIDYIHEETEVKKCCTAKNSLGILLPAIEKNAFFESIVHDGVLPRKTFSMGNSNDKRYYLECRKIK